MKKFAALILVLIFILSGCSENKSLGESDEVITDTEILRIKITDISNSQIALEIINESKCEAVYEEFYTLEFEKDGVWHRLKPKNENYAFIEVAYVLEKESTCTWGHRFEKIYGELPEGKYRLIKNFTVFESENDPGEKITLAVQFRVG